MIHDAKFMGGWAQVQRWLSRLRLRLRDPRSAGHGRTGTSERAGVDAGTGGGLV